MVFAKLRSRLREGVRRRAGAPGQDGTATVPRSGAGTGDGPPAQGPAERREVGSTRERVVTLRDERQGEDTRHLWAYVDGEGRLHVDGHDLGPATAPVSSDGEYEYFKTVAAADVPHVVALLGGEPGDDVLDLLERDWTDQRSYELEARLRDSAIPVALRTWSG